MSLTVLNEYLVQPLAEWLINEFLNQPILLSSIEFNEEYIEPVILYVDDRYVYFYHYNWITKSEGIKRYTIDDFSYKTMCDFPLESHCYPVFHCYQYQNLIGFSMFDNSQLVLFDVITGEKIHEWSLPFEKFKFYHTLQVWDCEKETLLFESETRTRQIYVYQCCMLSLSSPVIGSQILDDINFRFPFKVSSMIILPNSSIHIFEYDWNKTNKDKITTQCPNKTNIYHITEEFGRPSSIISNNVIYSDYLGQVFNIFQLPV